MSSPTIRPATFADRDAVLVLFRELERAQGRHRIFVISPQAEALFIASFERAVVSSDECFLIVEDGGLALGMAHCKIDRPSKLSDARLVEIGRVVVVPEARGRRLGRALVEAAAEFGRERGIGGLSARIFAGNAESLAFWQALGFVPFVETLVRRDV